MSEYKAFDDSAWDGSASNWPSTEAFCADCLIDTNPSGQSKTQDNCKLPYRKPGSSLINKNALRAIGAGAHGLEATNASPEDKKRVANWVISHWKSAFGQPAPEGMYRLAGKTRPSAGGKFFKDNSGDLWYLGIYSNNFEDRETDIISQEAHDEFVAWSKQTGIKGPIIYWHSPRLPDPFAVLLYAAYEDGKITAQRYQKALYDIYEPFLLAETTEVMSVGGFALVLGKVPERKKEIVKKLMSDDLAMSHGFINVESSDNIISRYRSFEFSVLPPHAAANVITMGVFNMAEAEDKGLAEEQRKKLNEVFGEGTDTALEKAIQTAAETLKEAGVLSKDVDEKAKPADAMPEDEMVECPECGAMVKKGTECKACAPKKKDYAEFYTKMVADLKMVELQDVIKSLTEAVTALRSEVDGLKAETVKQASQVKELQQSEDDKIAAMFRPTWTAGVSVTKDVSQEDADVVAKLKENIPVAPVLDEKNPLQKGFWSMLNQGQS